jgi:hypothetical protein
MNAERQPRCIIHCRVSSAKQAQEGESLSVQESICLQITRDRGWKLAHAPWLEAFSGRKYARPTFEEILEYLDRNRGEVNYYVFRAIDRFTRGGSYTYEKMKRELSGRGVEMIDSYGIIQPIRNTLADVGFEYEWSRQSPSEITEMVLATTSKQEVTTILTRMIGQEIRLTQRGFKIRGAHDGYRNEKIYVEGKKRTIQVADPERARFFVAMFELRAAGQLADAEIVDRLNALGYRSRLQRHWDRRHQSIIGKRGGIPLSVKQLQEIIKRPIYCGVVWEKWTHWRPVKAPYPGLVTYDVFNRANRGRVHIRETEGGDLELLTDYHPDHLKKLSHTNPAFPYKNVVVCPTCRKPFMGSASRSRSGKHVPAYHCARGHARIGINKATFDGAFEAFVHQLRFVPGALASIRATVLDRYHDRQADILQHVSSVGHNVADLEAQKAQTVQAFKQAMSDAMRRELEKDAERLDQEIQDARSVRDTLQITEEDVDAFIKDVKYIMEHPSELLLNPIGTAQQRALFALVFEVLPTYEEIASGTAKLCWIFRLSCEGADHQSGLVRLRELEWNQIEAAIAQWKELRGSLDLSVRESPILDLKAAA